MTAHQGVDAEDGERRSPSTWVVVIGHEDAGWRRVVRVLPLTGMLELDRKVFGLRFWAPEEVVVKQ